MEKEVEILFIDEVIEEGAKLFNVNTLEKLGSFENYVFSCKRDEQEFILRYTHSSHRTKEQVLAELIWLQFLKQKNAPVCGPFSSSNGNLVEEICVDGSFFYVSLFEKASGTPVKATEPTFNSELFYAWGKAIGRLHQLSSEYNEPENIVKRPALIEEFNVQFAPFLPKDEEVQQKVNKLLTKVQSLPTGKDRYRLIHSDIHPGNFFFDGREIIIFDFDDCSYHHLVSDIAIAIYYSAWFKHEHFDTRTKFINEQFLRAFIEGYKTEHIIENSLLNEIPLFLKLRDCELYGVLHKKWDLSALNEKQTLLLKEIRERIVNDTAIVSLHLNNIVEN